MGLFRKKATDTAEVGELRSELAALRDRLDASDRAKTELETTVEALSRRLILTSPEPPPPPVPPPVPVVDPAQVPADHPAVDPADHPADVAIDALQRQVTELDERLAALDDRVTSVSTELANQLAEIGDDIEPMHHSAERLAAEQARYQIRFRQDLAELAERIRRPGNS